MSLRKGFWKDKPLTDLSREEWEALCDGCGQCCLYKLEDEDSGDLYLTNVVCRFLDPNTCHCQVYEERRNAMPTCVKLTPENIATLPWIPPTCAYKLISESKSLPKWHHLISGSQETVHSSGQSVRGRTISESGVDLNDLENFVIS